MCSNQLPAHCCNLRTIYLWRHCARVSLLFGDYRIVVNKSIRYFYKKTNFLNLSRITSKPIVYCGRHSTRFVRLGFEEKRICIWTLTIPLGNLLSKKKSLWGNISNGEAFSVRIMHNCILFKAPKSEEIHTSQCIVNV